jgi:hypothetical protein
MESASAVYPKKRQEVQAHHSFIDETIDEIVAL